MQAIVGSDGSQGGVVLGSAIDVRLSTVGPHMLCVSTVAPPTNDEDFIQVSGVQLLARTAPPPSPPPPSLPPPPTPPPLYPPPQLPPESPS
eukprot:6174208-Pleurochrysis_carterae.AAC.1